MRRLRAILVVLAVLLGACASADATKTSASRDVADVRQAMDHFLAALNGLDLDAMSACFTSDVTAFVPAAQPDRVNGRPAVVTIFRNFVERTKPAASRLTITPEDLQIETSGNLAIVTFNVREMAVTRRRTFVFRRSADGPWLICHFHASDFPVPPSVPAESHLIGTWRLVEFWNRSAGDQVKRYPFGEEPIGFFVYDSTGHLFIQIARNPQPARMSREELAKATPEELRAMIEGYVAYFGTYSVDAQRGVVVHHVIGDVRREYTDTDQDRPFRLTGDDLVIGDGNTWFRRLVRVTSSGTR